MKKSLDPGFGRGDDFLRERQEYEEDVNKRAIIDIDNTLWPFSDAFYLELKKSDVLVHILKAFP